MPANIDDQRISDIKPLPAPADIIRDFPRTDIASATVANGRRAVERILDGHDDRLVVVIGPCSIHDPGAALGYAHRLSRLRSRLGSDLEIIMRIYFAKPRTTVGWKGLISDPDLDGGFRVDEGLRIARKLLLDVNHLGLPAASEFLDLISPQYLADLVAWGAIGARTTESQPHRELVSGLSCPVGFKNGTDGRLKIAVDALKAAAQPHRFLALTKQGRSAVATTTGNRDCHVILRGGHSPNYDAESVATACDELRAAGLTPNVMIDASHANSGYRPEHQPHVVNAIADQVAGGDERIMGVMIESNLVAGRQDHVSGRPLIYGQSITDACIDWDTSVDVLERLAQAVQARRIATRRGHLEQRPGNGVVKRKQAG